MLTFAFSVVGGVRDRKPEEDQKRGSALRELFKENTNVAKIIVEG